MSPFPTRPEVAPPLPRRGARGQALVITMAMVVIAAMLVTAFFLAVRSDLTATASYGESLRAEQLGLGALQMVVGQLQQEMGKDALPLTGGPLVTNALYTNVSTANRNVLPQPVGTNAAMPSLVKISTNANFYDGTLTKGVLRASDVNAASSPSLNGRTVGVSRWNQAYLGSFPGKAATPFWIPTTRGGLLAGATAMTFGAEAPGSVNNPATGNTNYVLGRFAYAVYNEGDLLDVNAAGYAPTGSAAPSTDQLQSLKGTLAGADLTQIGITDPGALVAWRNKTTGATVSSYLTYATNTAATNGFLQVARGDRTFLNRQDLIMAAQTGTAGLTTAALTNLTTFTRDATLPSWAPSTNAPAAGVYNYASNAANSTTSPFSSASPNPNRFVSAVVFPSPASVSSYHSDGSSYSYPVQAGDALLQHRFPLERIQWIGPGGPNAAAGGTAANIQACFGLKWGVSSYGGATYSVWQYVGSGTSEQSTIETLDQVAAEKREPNFFELLQAGILNGSLGVAGDKTGTATAYAYQYKNALQLFRIGAAIIDQYRADAYPTVVEYNQSGSAWQACGVKNLPYVNLLKPITGVSPAGNTQAAVYLLVGLWNPHQSPATVTRPSVRLHLKGSAYVYNNWGNYSYQALASISASAYIQSFDSTILLSSGAAAGAGGFHTPNLLTSADVASAPSDPGSSGNGWAVTPSAAFSSESSAQYVGYRLPDFSVAAATSSATGSSGFKNSKSGVNIPTAWATDTSGTRWRYLGVQLNDPTQCSLEYEAYPPGSGVWVPYSFLSGLNDSANTWSANAVGTLGCRVYLNSSGNIQDPPTFGPLEQTFSGTGVLMSGDPRSLRFGSWTFIRNAIRDGASSPDAPNALIAPLWDAAASSATSTNYSLYGYGGGQHSAGNSDGPSPVNAGGVPPLFLGTYAKTSYYPAQLARNNMLNGGTAGNKVTAYADNDGIQRIGDSGLFPATLANLNAATGNPYQRAADQPVLLARPFASVAEMGYALRDDPWRTLDFFSANSADAGLLDLFSLREEPPVVTAGKTVVAGRVSLNTKNAAVLAALLSGAVIDPVAKTTISPAVARQLAASIVKATSAAPLANKAQLATALAPAVTMGATAATVADPLTGFANADHASVKAYRESYVRALADVGQTRVWNLMIDLVAQAGRYPPGATAPDQFLVEGERRYWLHVALDRYTGKVLDQQMETVAQ